MAPGVPLAAGICLFLSSVAIPAPSWVPGTPPPPTPSRRQDHALAFDAARGVTILFGGRGPLGDTWRFDGTWAPLQPAASPPPRGEAGFVYDSARARLVLFGGVDGATGYGDTWFFDGSAWTRGPDGPATGQASGRCMVYDTARDRIVLVRNDATIWEFDGGAWAPGVAPPATFWPRTDAAAAYDESRRITVVFGGLGTSYNWLKDTWEYDGTTWTQGPAAPYSFYGRHFHSMTFDPIGNRVVLFGGKYGPTALSNEIWLYDGSAWTQGTYPPYELRPRCRTSITFDRTRSAMVLFGGLADYPGPVQDTWLLDASGWRRDASLTERSGHAMTYDDRRQRVVLFGGYDGSALGDTWEHDGSAWIEGPAAPPGLSPRSNLGLAFDRARGRTVLFGGISDGGGALGGTWEYDGTAWTPGAGTSPPARMDHGMAYDARRSRMVVHGGYRSPNVLDDTWEYDGTGWTPGASPGPKRWSPAMVYDAGAGSILLFGGSDINSPTWDTWMYDGASWTPGAPPASTLWPRVRHAMVYVESRGVTVLFGGRNGNTYMGDTWEHDGAWTRAWGEPPALGLRHGHAMAYDASRGVIVLFGGYDGTGWRADVWEYPCNIGVAPATLPPAVRGWLYSQILTASGGTPPYTFSVTAGTLPAGMTLSPGGRLSGAPTTPGSSTFTVGARDATGCLGARSYTLVVVLPVNPVVGRGHGSTNPNEVAVRNPQGAPTSVVFDAYAAGAWGTNVSSGDVDGGAYAEILTGPGPGAVLGPQVRAFFRDGTPLAKVNFYAYATLAWGVNVGTGRVDTDAFREILTAPGPGAPFGPHVRGFNYDGTSIAAMGKLSFFAYGTLQYGARAACGDIDGDGFEEILTGPGPGPTFAPQVRGFDFDGVATAAIAKINFEAYAVRAYGVDVASGDAEADGFAEIVTAPGPGGSLLARFRGWNFDGVAIAALPAYDVTPYATGYGGRAALGALVPPDGRARLLTGAGPAPAAPSTVFTFDYQGGTLSPGTSFQPFPGAFGVNPAAGELGYP